MPGFLQEHLRPLAGSAGLHLALLVVLAGVALRWTSSQPPVELAIEGYVVDAPPAASRPIAQPRSTPPVTEPPPAAEQVKPPEPVKEPAQERRAEEAAAAERAAQADRERREAAERATRERDARLAQEKAAAEERRAEEAEAKRRQAAEDAARRKAEAEETKRKADEQAQAQREAKARSEREAELQRALAAEEDAAAVARSGVMDEYRALLVQTIERNWIRPPSARAGLQCTLYVSQAPGGTVTDVRLGPCNGDQAVRESITNAVYRASPLPAPRDPRAFERRLEIVFKPKE
jgi:colicin import membrane protein